MVFRRVAALGFLAIILSALATVSSCTDPQCADGGEGCPCQSVYECGSVPACTTPYCDGSCALIQLDVGAWCDLETCIDAEHCGGRCNEAGACLQCLDASHCDTGHTCEPGNVCSRCDDGLKNGDETNVDCGGSCPLCPGTCNVDTDCPNGYCWKGLCARCDDGVKNGNEHDIDCSMYGDGGRCPICYGILCEKDTDCASNACEHGLCCKTPCPVCYECSFKDGACVPMGSGTSDDVVGGSPGVACVYPYQCNGKGACKLKFDQPCVQDVECSSEMCINGTCY